MIIVGKKCENCQYSDIDDTNKAMIIVHCRARDKNYYWGQCIPCEDYRKKENEEDENQY